MYCTIHCSSLLNFSVYRAALQTNLELLQRQQKELEQENEKKKALLEQTLQERYNIATELHLP